MKKRPLRLLALVLVLCCIVSQIQLVSAVSSKLTTEQFQAPFVSTSGTAALGNFLKQGSSVYVELGTLQAMGSDVEVCLSESGQSFCVYRQMQTGTTLSPSQDVRSIEFPIDDTLVNNKGVFVPFTMTMEVLGLNPIVDEAGQQLIIINAGNVDQLGGIMEDIYEEACYNMRYWKDSENYRRDVAFAEMVGAIRDLNLISFVSGKTTYEGYQEAFAQLIMPQDKADVDFSTGTNETLGMINTLFSVADGVADFALEELELDLMGDLKDTYETVFGLVNAVTTSNEVLAVDDQIELIAYFQAAREAEEAIIRGLKEIMTETPGISKKMDSALQKVMATYEENDPLWVQVIDSLGSKTLGSVENLLKEYIPQSYLFDVGNEITNYYMGTGDQVAATAQASRFLDIQTCCQQVFDEVLPSYKTTMGQSKGEYLQIMYDVTNLYLSAGIHAQKAMSQVDELKDSTNYSIQRLKEEQALLAQFSETDIQSYANYEKAKEWLLSVKNVSASAKKLESPKLASVSSLPDMPTFITITWESEVDGIEMDLTANITGTLDDGTSVRRAASEGEYITSSGRVATHYDYGQWIELEVLRSDAVLDVMIDYGDVNPFTAPSYAEANVDIHIFNPLGTIAVIAANPEESTFAGSPDMVSTDYFLLRGGTGVYFFAFQLDHGNLKGLSGEYVLESAPEESLQQGSDVAGTVSQELIRKSFTATKSGNRLDEYYTSNGQLQYSERYNPDGYKLESCWFDNGECTAYTQWTYNENNHLTRIRYKNIMEPNVVQMDFQNTYSGNKLKKVALYNVAGKLLGEGATAADAADAVGMRMLVEESLPQ